MIMHNASISDEHRHDADLSSTASSTIARCVQEDGSNWFGIDQCIMVCFLTAQALCGAATKHVACSLHDAGQGHHTRKVVAVEVTTVRSHFPGPPSLLLLPSLLPSGAR